ncbi:hypothetical protein PSTG_07878 [Puccinia striiformis f. sp. tritici PST-78]|uniref:Uncharacterized protein n=1 Tax=Puccinia striiformis f. sp. tritici PST-78 TaxID=1165861 RepID=A0A0L0VHT5_9BASI|nr:hypothetical protein PSTG_07878 [Puccinia striiformis f. sp. tritici PST-78]
MLTIPPYNRSSPTPPHPINPRPPFQQTNDRSRESDTKLKNLQSEGALTPFDQLRVTVGKDPEYERLTVADKLKAENIYRTYQIAIYQLAIKNKLHIKPLLEYLGNNTCIQGPTNYNFFCKYDPVAGLIHRDHTLHVNNRAQ